MPGRSSPPVKVLFIAGWGRSGTTILDNVLGAHEGVFTAGEVHLLWRFGFVEGRTCGCTTPFVDCELWREIFAAAFGDTPPDPQRMLELQHDAFGIRHTPALLAGARRRTRSPAVREYSAMLARLFRAIAQVTGCRVIVDASKRPPDAAVVGQVEGIDPYLLHVVRDPRAVAFSWQRNKLYPDARTPVEMHRHGRLKNGAHWLGWNLGAEAAASAYPTGRYRRLRYEDLMAEPRRTIEKVFDFLGEPVRPPGSFRDDRTIDLPVNHTIAGNPSRFRTGEVRLQLDDEWVTAQRPIDRTAASAMAAPLLRRYRYPLAVTDATSRRGHTGPRSEVS